MVGRKRYGGYGSTSEGSTRLGDKRTTLGNDWYTDIRDALKAGRDLMYTAPDIGQAWVPDKAGRVVYCGQCSVLGGTKRRYRGMYPLLG